MTQKTLRDIPHATKIIRYPFHAISYVLVDTHNNGFDHNHYLRYCIIRTDRFGKDYIRFNKHTYYLNDEED